MEHQRVEKRWNDTEFEKELAGALFLDVLARYLKRMESLRG